VSSTKQNRFVGVPRGRPLPGSRAIARHIWNDEERRRSAFRLPRDQYGLAVVCGELLGYEGWVDFALAAGAERSRPRSKAAGSDEAA
jgi:hypothetical protein